MQTRGIVIGGSIPEVGLSLLKGLRSRKVGKMYGSLKRVEVSNAGRSAVDSEPNGRIHCGSIGLPPTLSLASGLLGNSSARAP